MSENNWKISKSKQQVGAYALSLLPKISRGRCSVILSVERSCITLAFLPFNLFARAKTTRQCDRNTCERRAERYIIIQLYNNHSQIGSVFDDFRCRSLFPDYADSSLSTFNARCIAHHNTRPTLSSQVKVEKHPFFTGGPGFFSFRWRVSWLQVPAMRICRVVSQRS